MRGSIPLPHHMDGYTEIEVDEILFATEKAFKVSVHDTDIWVPKSVVFDADAYDTGDRNVILAMRDWFVDKNEL